MLRDSLHFAASLVDSYARFEPRVCVNSRMIAAICFPAELVFQPPKRCEYVRLPQAAMELCGKNPDDRVGFRVQIELLSNDIRIVAEAALPKSFPQ